MTSKRIQVCTFAFFFAQLIVSTAALAANDDYDKVNGSINIEAGRKVGSVSTVNGSISIGDDASVAKADTVNGSVTLGARTKATSVSAVNGRITLAREADVSGALGNVNGDIKLDGAHVAGGIRTNSGSIDIGANSRIEGGILVEKSSGWSLWKGEPPRVVIGPGAVVQGTLKFEREVKLYVSDRATIGTVVGATPIRFAGDTAPK